MCSSVFQSSSQDSCGTNSLSSDNCGDVGKKGRIAKLVSRNLDMVEIAGSSPATPTMKDYIKEEANSINERMIGWTVDRVEFGRGEDHFIFHMSKDSNHRVVTLCGNDLGAWLSPRSRGPKKARVQ